MPRMLRRAGIAVALGVLTLPAAAEAAPGMLSIEGTFSYVEVKDSGGHVVIRRTPARRPVRMLRHLRSGVYTVAANRRAARCARRDRGARERAPAQALHHDAPGAAGALPS
jgi:hypothetical protein